MAYRIEQNQLGKNELVIDGFEKGIAPSPYKGIANIRNLNTSYYPGVSYVNYRRQAATLSGSGFFYAGSHSIDEGNNTNWIFSSSPSSPTMTNPVSKCTSAVGRNYIQDDSGQIWKQSAVNSSTFTILDGGSGRLGDGNAGIAYWNNYLVVFGGGFIEFCGDGTGDNGIISSNWNNIASNFAKKSVVYTTIFSGVPYYIYPTSPYFTDSLPRFKVGDPVTFSSTGTLSSPLVAGTTYYISSTVNGVSSYTISPIFGELTLTSSVSGGATTATLSTPFTPPTGTYTVKFSNNDARSVVITNGGTALSWTGGLSGVATNLINVYMTFTNDGTGTQTMTDISTVVPLGNITGITGISFTGSNPYTGFSFDDGAGNYGSYVNPQGVTVTGIWQEATGLYNVVMANGQVVPTNFTNGSPNANFLSTLLYISRGTWTATLINTTVTDYRPYVSKVDGSLYFANGQFVGRIATNSDPNITFYPTVPSSYVVSVGVTAIPEQFTDTVVCMTDLQNTLVVAGQKDVYTWDYLSASTSSPSPVGEQIADMVNLLNNIYILAGTKGNIYVSNGYSVQFLYKIPDFISGAFDPVWKFGGLMVHRSKLFFQALAKTTSGTNILAGIFSLIVSPSTIGETASGMVMESQNSYGLTPSSGSLQGGVLISNESYSNGEDSYYSAWSNGSSTGGIDYNDTSLWQNYEPVIETDIIPIGTILESRTFGNIEFKLDRPLSTGDSIRLSWRPSLSDSYTLMGTTTSSQLSDYYISNIEKSQWVQFKIEMSCATSGSSGVPISEVRLHFN